MAATRNGAQKDRKLNLQLFLLNAQGGRAMIVLDTGACRSEISFVRTALLGGGLENRLAVIFLGSIWSVWCAAVTATSRRGRELGFVSEARPQ